MLVATALCVMSCNAKHSDDTEHGELHEHSESDGHHHASGHETGGNDNEIVFTAEQAKAAGLMTEVVKASPFVSVIKTSGQILSPQGDEQTVVATNAGTVSFANGSIADGTPVRSGETIVTISSQNLQEGDPTLKAKIAYETAGKEYRRAEELVADKIISAKEFEQIRMRYETARAAFKGVSARITASGVRVTSPMTGYIKKRLVSQGDYVSVGQPIATVVKNKRLQLRADVPERYFKAVKNVRSANFKTTYDNALYRLSDMNGRLLSYARSSGSESFYIPVTFEFDNVGDVIPGSYVEVYLLASQREDVISVPLSSITDEQGVNYVYVQTEPEGYVRREVTVGENNGERAEIICGLKDGEKVVTKGVVQVKLAAVSGIIPEGHSH